MENAQLLNAHEAGRILGVNANLIYKLWKAGELDFWYVNGKKQTTLPAIADFLGRTRNIDMTAKMKGQEGV